MDWLERVEKLTWKEVCERVTYAVTLGNQRDALERLAEYLHGRLLANKGDAADVK